jgi:hypothetical protein
VLIPRLGLLGAAIGAGAGIAIEQILSAAWAMRRLRLSANADLLPQIWRCVVATGAMAAVLWQTGLGWVTMDLTRLPLAVAAGALVYGAALFGLWGSTGRPAGPEADLLALLGRVLRRPRVA